MCLRLLVSVAEAADSYSKYKRFCIDMKTSFLNIVVDISEA